MPKPEDHNASPRLQQSFGRRRGKPLRVTKQSLVDTLLPQLILDVQKTDVSTAEALISAFLPSASPPTEFYLEIGFGGGEHLAHQASLYPNIGIIGCEPYLNGVAGLLKHIDDEKLHNIRIYPDDARLLLEKLPDASISKVFILYPDPWPKIRHKKRRLIATPLLNQLARIMKQGAELRIATDDDDYCTWILEHVLPHPAFTWPAKTSADWLNAPKDWVTTRYEQKKAVNRGLIPSYLNFIRKP